MVQHHATRCNKKQAKLDKIMSGKREIIRVCEYCGNAFTAQRTTTKYCSHKCNSRAYKKHKREETINLANAGQSFKMVGANYSTAKETERLSVEYEKIEYKQVLTVIETAFLLSVDRTTIYRYLRRGNLKAVQMEGKTFIRRSDIDAMFDNAKEYRLRPKPINKSKAITEFYTVEEIKEKYNIQESWLYKIIRENNIPKTLVRGMSYISKSHIDKYFKKSGFNEHKDIEEWYSVKEIKEKYSLTDSAIYSFISENKIPKKKIGRNVLYSKYHFEIAKGYITPIKEEYYTVQEAIEKYNVTRDALYNYIKYHNITKIKEGRYIKVSKTELDNLLNPQIT